MQYAAAEAHESLRKPWTPSLRSHLNPLLPLWDSFRSTSFLALTARLQALMACLVMTFDPPLTTFALVVAALVMGQVALKLVGSIMYQLNRLGVWVCRHWPWVVQRLYRVETDPAGRRRLVSKWHGAGRHPYALDALWESEHPYGALMYRRPEGLRKSALR